MARTRSQQLDFGPSSASDADYGPWWELAVSGVGSVNEYKAVMKDGEEIEDPMNAYALMEQFLP